MADKTLKSLNFGGADNYFPLPIVSTNDNDNILVVADGEWVAKSPNDITGQYVWSKKDSADGPVTGYVISNDGEKYPDGGWSEGIYYTLELRKQILINFIIEYANLEPISCQAEEGMTWSEWVASDYNTSGFTISADTPYHKDYGYLIDPNTNHYVSSSSVIVDGYAYNGNICCFVAGTQIAISTNGETKSIETLKQGDEVLSYNIKTNEFYLTEVRALIANENTIDIAEVYFDNGESLIMNAYHPILTEDGFKSITGYNGYGILTIEDKAKTINGYSIITDIVRYNSDPIITYNLSIHDYGENPDDDTNDTYVANSIVVHNAPHCPIAPVIPY